MGHADALDVAIAAAVSEAKRFKEDGQTDWYVSVIDLAQPHHSSNPPTARWETCFLLEG